MDAAKSAADELQAAGYGNLRVHRAPTKSLWKRWFGPHEYSCIAETHAVPSQEAVFATTDRMNALAEKFGGDYDGWEASVENRRPGRPVNVGPFPAGAQRPPT
jgi:hypothetical protein